MNSDRSWKEWMEEKFLFRERNTDFTKESRAALATFFTMSYILLVNPQLLSKLGLSADAIVVSTALASAVSCFLTGFFGYSFCFSSLHETFSFLNFFVCI